VTTNDLLANPDVQAVSVVTMWDQHTAPTLAAGREVHVHLRVDQRTVGMIQTKAP
jgi:hypothetical protein